MRLVVVVVLVMVFGCTGSAETTVAPPRAPAPTLDEFQLDCRASELAYLNEANTRIGPTCDGQTMPVTLGSFDQGTEFASLDARHVMKLLTFVCLCEDSSCGEPQLIHARQALANARESQKKNYRERVNRLVSGLARSSCLDSTVAGELFQRGYVCAFDAATREPTLRHQMDADFAKLLPGPPGQAADLSAKCWNSVVPSPAGH